MKTNHIVRHGGVIVAGILVTAPCAWAAHFGRTAATGTWGDANWISTTSGSGVPTTGDDATIGRNFTTPTPNWLATAEVTLTDARTIKDLYVGYALGDNGTLNIDNTGGGGAHLTLSGQAYIGAVTGTGSGGTGTINLIGTDAKITSAGFIRLGANNAGTGVINLNGVNSEVILGGAGGLVIDRPGSTVNFNGAGSKITFQPGADLWVRSGGTASLAANRIALNSSGYHIDLINLPDSGTFTQNQDLIVRSIDLASATPANVARYVISAGQVLTVQAGGTGLRIFDSNGATGGLTENNVFRGAGTVILNKATDGGLFRHGRIVADGNGVNSSLVFVRSVAGDIFSYDATVGPANTTGWYAENTGRLELPALTITGTGTNRWGDIRTGGTERGLVNSLRFTNWTGFDGTPAGDDLLTAALLATDRAEVPAGLVNPIGVWDINVSGFTFTSVDLTIRYDHVAAGANESNMKLWHYDGTDWVLTSFTLDTTNKRITGHGLTSFSYYAIATDYVPLDNPSVPEPSTVFLLLVGAGLLCRRWGRNTK